MDDNKKDIATVLSYREITFPLGVNVSKEFETIKKDIILKIQGQAVIISDSLDVIFYALMIPLIYNLTQELVLKTSDGKYFIIFSHLDDNRYLRPDYINDEILQQINESQDLKFVKNKKDVLEFNLPAIWQTLGLERSNKSIAEKVKEILMHIADQAYLSEEIRLVGRIDVLPFLSILCLLRPLTSHLIYLDSELLGPIKVF